MNRSRLSAVVILVSAAILLAGCGKGDEPEPAPTPQHKSTGGIGAAGAPSIMECIPAGSSYFMTNSIAKTIDSTEMFLIDIGVGQMLGIGVAHPGGGRPPRSVLLEKLKGLFKFGEGFDPKGAAAVVIVNPAAGGIDFLELLKAAEAQAKASGKPVSYRATIKPREFVAIVLPGTLEAFFAHDESTKEGRLTVTKMAGEKTYAAQKGPYVVLSPTKTAVTAILDAEKNAGTELSADEIALIKGSELAVHYDIRPFRPLAGKVMDELATTLEKSFDKPTAAGLKVYLMMARGLMNQMDTTTFGVKLGQNGVNIDSISTAKTGSTAAKVFAAESATPGGAKVLDSLPSMPYVAAMGVNGWMNNPTLHAAMVDMSKAMMGPDSIYKVDEKTKARMTELQTELAGMITGLQLVLGGAPKGKGMFSVAYVIKCKDSAKYRAMFPEGIELSNKMLAGLEMPPGSPKIAMTYTKDAEKVDGVSVDSMNILLSQVPGDDKDELPKMLKMVLGEENIRLLIATPDARTMVMTIGGSTEAMSQALKVCAGKGPIPAMPGTAAVMRNLPENPSIVALLNVANLLDVIRTGTKAAGMPPESIKMVPVINCKTPIAFGAKAKGATLQTGLYVAKPLIKEAVQAVMATIARDDPSDKPRVALIMKSLANEFFKAVEDGARAHQKANAEKYDLIVNGIKNERDLTEQIGLVEQMIAQQVDAIVIAPADSKALVPVCKKARDAGIVVVNIDNKFDAGVLAEKKIKIPFVGPDNRKGARLAGEYLATKLSAGDEVGIIEGAPNAFNGIQRKLGFEDAMKAAGMKIVSARSGHWEPDRAMKVAAGMIARYPKLKALLCANDGMAVGAVAALGPVGKQGKVLVIGYDNISAIQEFMKAGKVLCTVDQHADRIAVYGIQYALEIIEKKTVPADKQTPVDLIKLDDLK